MKDQKQKAISEVVNKLLETVKSEKHKTEMYHPGWYKDD